MHLIAVCYSVCAPQGIVQVDCSSLGCGSLDGLAAKCMDHRPERQAVSAWHHQMRPLVDKAAFRWGSSRSDRYFCAHFDPKLEYHMTKDSHSPAEAPGTPFDSVPPAQRQYSVELERSRVDTLVSLGVIEDGDVSSQSLVRYLDALVVEVEVRVQQEVVATIAPLPRARARARRIHWVCQIHRSRCMQGLGAVCFVG